MFYRVSAAQLARFNIRRREAAVFDLAAPALMAVIRRHEPICGALRHLAGTIIDKVQGLADEQPLPFSADESVALPE
jgi:hypothetical protein